MDDLLKFCLCLFNLVSQDEKKVEEVSA
jgi:hypothetical protein